MTTARIAQLPPGTSSTLSGDGSQRLPHRSNRQQMLAKIHIAKKEMALSDDDYRAVLRRVINADSAATATDKGLDLILRDLKRLGWKPTRGYPRQGGDDARKRKATALWITLHQVGAIQDPSPSALSAYIRRQTGQDIGTLDASQWNAVINGLRGWQQRVTP